MVNHGMKVLLLALAIYALLIMSILVFTSIALSKWMIVTAFVAMSIAIYFSRKKK